MPQAKDSFDSAIKDADDLLFHFDRINTETPLDNAEVRKPAGLIMTLTAWQTYVEDRILELVSVRLGGGNDSFQNRFPLRHPQQTLKSFNTPDAKKTSKLFADHLDLEYRAAWRWKSLDPESAELELGELVNKRGEGVHRARASLASAKPPPLIRREALEKAMRFLRSLVDAIKAATASRSKFLDRPA